MRPRRTTRERRRSNPPGCPSARVQSPGRALVKSPGGACGHGPRSSILARPVSVSSSTPKVLPRTRLPSGKMNVTQRSGRPQTWPAVNTRPSGEITTPLPMALPISRATTAGDTRATRLVTCRSMALRSSSETGLGRVRAAGNELRSPCAGRRGPRLAAPWADGTDPGSAAMATAAIPRTSNAPLRGGARNHLDSQNQSTTRSSLEAHPLAAIQALLNLNF